MTFRANPLLITRVRVSQTREGKGASPEYITDFIRKQVRCRLALAGMCRSYRRSRASLSPLASGLPLFQGIFTVPITLDDVSAVCLALFYDGLIEYHHLSRTKVSSSVASSPDSCVTEL